MTARPMSAPTRIEPVLRSRLTGRPTCCSRCSRCSAMRSALATNQTTGAARFRTRISAACRPIGRPDCCRHRSRSSRHRYGERRRGSANASNVRLRRPDPPVGTSSSMCHRRCAAKSTPITPPIEAVHGQSSSGGHRPEGALLDSNRDCLRNRVDVVRRAPPLHAGRLDPCPYGRKHPDAVHPAHCQARSSRPFKRNAYEMDGAMCSLHARSCHPSSIMNAAGHPVSSLPRPVPDCLSWDEQSTVDSGRRGPVRKRDLSETQRPADRPSIALLDRELGHSVRRPGQYCPMIRAHVTGEHPCSAAADRRHSCKVRCDSKVGATTDPRAAWS